MTEYIIDFARYEIDEDGEIFYPNAQEVVRCRDCKHFTYADAAHGDDDWCAKHEHIGWSVNGFCAWGERLRGDA